MKFEENNQKCDYCFTLKRIETQYFQYYGNINYSNRDNVSKEKNVIVPDFLFSSLVSSTV